MSNMPFFEILAIVLGFGFLVFIHELGHFLVAKWVGIRATQFAIGFGQAIVTYRKGIGFKVGTTEPEYFRRATEHLKANGDTAVEPNEAALYAAADELGLGETEYRLNWMPLGGYVKMLGQEDMDPNAQSSDPRAYNNKSIGARAAVISAGVVMNIITAFIFFIVAFTQGVDFPSPRVGSVEDGAPAATVYAQGHDNDPAYLGLQPGDLITHINDKPINDFSQVMMASALGDPNKQLHIRVERRAEDQPLTFIVSPEPNELTEGLLSIGITPSQSLIIDGVVQETPGGEPGDLYEQGVRAGMVIRQIDGQDIESFTEFVGALDDARGQPLPVTFHDPAGPDITAELASLPLLAPSEQGRSLLGMRPPVEVGLVVPDSPAEEAGMEAGDLIAQVGDLAWPGSAQDIINEVQSADGPLPVMVWRDGELVDLDTITPNRKKQLGMQIGWGFENNRLAIPTEDTPDALADLPSGSQVVAVNGQPVERWSDLQRLLMDAADADAESVTLTVLPLVADAQPRDIALPLDADARATLLTASWMPSQELILDQDKVVVQATGPVNAIAIGLTQTKTAAQQVYVTLLRLFQGSVGVKNLRGPVGIIDAGRHVAARGLPWYLYFLGLISINLAVLNFLPIPIVDGGHIVFLLYEKFRGKPAGPKVQTAALLAGLAVIATLFVVVTFHDIARLIG